MNAKGLFHTITILVLVILILFIILFAYYAKGTGLFAKLANLIAEQSTRFLPAEPKKELKQDEKLPQKVINTQKNFIDSLKTFLSQRTDDKICRVALPSLAGMDDFGIEVSNLNNNINSKIIKPKSAEGYLALSMLAVENAQVCLIHPEIFYQCYVTSERNCPQNTEGLYKNIDIVTIQNGKINDGKQTYQLAKHIIKINNNRFCFIPLHSGFLTKIGCDPSTSSLDNDCVSQLVREIPVCGAGVGAAQPDEKQKLAIMEFDRFVSFLRELNLQSKAQLCRKNFFFNVKSIGSRFYIYINPNSQIDLRYNRDAGQVIKRENINYIPYGTLSSQDYVKTHFDNYDSFKQTFILSPAGDYSTSDLAVAVIQEESIIAVNRDNKWFLTKSNPYINSQPVCI